MYFFPTGWCLMLEQARLFPFLILPTPTSVPQIQFHSTMTMTTPPVAASTRVPITSDFSAQAT